MGMYTEIIVAMPLLSPTDQVLDLLRIMGGDDSIKLDSLPDHPLFKTTRWKLLLCCSSFYHIPFAKFYLEEIHGTFYLLARADLKNYDGEIDHFFDWIAPYSGRNYMGSSMYEESDEPTLHLKEVYEARAMEKMM